MDFLHKWEKKWKGRAIPHLTRYIIMTYVAGYILMMVGSMTNSYDSISSMLTLMPSRILHGQVWRLVSWLLIPPNSLTRSAMDILTIIMLFVYYQLGSLLEQVWGDFLYNVYIFVGLIMTIIGAFLLYFATGVDYGAMFSTYYVSLSIFLGFAMTFPEQQMLFMFIIPIKIKYLAIVDIIYLVYSVIQAARFNLWLPVLVMILCSLAGTILFFFGTKGFKSLSKRGNDRTRAYRRQVQQARAASQRQSQSGWGTPGGQQGRPGQAGYGQQGRPQRSKIDRETFAAPPKIAIHRCAICGRTELDDPDLEFRFCSKCNGNYEYCADHLHSHEHVL